MFTPMVMVNYPIPTPMEKNNLSTVNLPVIPQWGPLEFLDKSRLFIYIGNQLQQENVNAWKWKCLEILLFLLLYYWLFSL